MKTKILRSSRNDLLVFVALIMALFFTITVNAANRYSVATGNWNSTATWSATSGGLPGASFPVAGDNAFIENSNTVTVTVAAACANLSLSGSSSLTNNGTITMSGNVSLNGTSSITQNATFTITGNLVIGNGTTFTADSHNLTVTGTTTVGGGASGSLIFSSATGQKQFTGLVTIAFGGTWNDAIGRDVIFEGGITSAAWFSAFTAGTAMYIFQTNSQAVTGQLPMYDVKVTGVTLTNNGYLTAAHSLVGTGSLINAASGTLFIGFTGPPTIAAITVSAAGNSVVYNRAGNQNILTTTYYNLGLEGSGIKSMSSGITTVNGQLSIPAGVSATIFTGTNDPVNVLILGGNPQPSGTWGGTGSGATHINSTFFNASTGFLTVATTLTQPSDYFRSQATGDWHNYSTWQSSSDNVNWGNASLSPTNAAALITIRNPDNVSIDLVGSNASSLVIQSGGTLTAGNNTLTVSGNWTNNGLFTSATGTVYFNATSAGKTIAGTLTGTSKFYDIAFIGVGGGWTFLNNAEVANDFGISSGSVTAPASLTVAGNYWNNGGTFTNNSGTVTFNSTSSGKTISGNLTGANKFNVLTFNGAGGGWTLNDNTEVGSNLNITNGVLTVAAGKDLTVTGTTTSSNSSSFVLKSDATGTASLLHHTASVPATVERYLAGSEWHQISSPISNAVSGMFTGYNLQEWKICNWADVILTTLPLTPMKGFAFYDAANFTAQYVGLLNEGTIGSADDLPAEPNCCGLHVVGNPYPSSIDWDASSGWTKTNLDNAVYIHVNSSTWASYIGGVGLNGGSRYIAPGQGFIVFSTNINNPSTLIMDDNVRVHSTAPFFKDDVTNFIRLEVSGGNNYQDETVIRFLPEATTGFDRNWDAFKILGDVSEAPQIYSLMTDQGFCTNQLSINALPQTQAVPLGMTTSAQGTYTIKATEINGLDGIRLEDKTNGTFTDLAATPYTFTFEPGQNDSRFVLHFNPLGINDPKVEIAEIYSFGGTLNVNMKENGNLYVYSMTGQLIMSAPVNSGTNKLDLTATTGNYIVKIVTSNNSMVKKVFIK